MNTRAKPKKNQLEALESALAREVALGRNKRKTEQLRSRIEKLKGNAESDYDLTKVFGGSATKRKSKTFTPPRKTDERLIEISEKKIRGTYIALAKWMIGVNDPEINGFPSGKGLLHKKQYFKTVNTERRKAGKSQLSMEQFMTESRRQARSITKARSANLRQDNLAIQAARDRLIANHFPATSHTTDLTDIHASEKPATTFIESSANRKIRNAYINLAKWMVRINDLEENERPSQLGITHKLNYLSFVNKERSKLGQRQLTLATFMSGVRSEVEDLVKAGKIKKTKILVQSPSILNTSYNSLPGRPIPLLATR